MQLGAILFKVDLLKPQPAKRPRGLQVCKALSSSWWVHQPNNDSVSSLLLYDRYAKNHSLRPGYSGSDRKF